MPDIFLSYSREDQATARQFADALTREGFEVWWDQALNAGEAFDRVTEKALQDARAVVVLWSPRSVESNWVRAEAAEADAGGKLVPVLIEPCNVPIKFKLTQTADLSGWKGELSAPAWQSLVAGLARGRGEPGGRATAAAASVPAAPRPRRLWPALTGGVALLVAIAAVLWWRGMPGGQASPDAPVTLAVLPFVNLSADPEQEYFSDGLTEEILNELAQIPDLRVTGRTSSFAYKGRNEDLRTIASELNVANLLEGSVRRDGQSLRVTAQLIDGRDGAHLWSKTYDRQVNDVLAVQSEVAADVAQALSVKLGANDISRAKGGTTNVEAYDLWLKVRSMRVFNRTPAERRQALQLARETVRLDPQFSLGWSQLYYVANLVPPGSAQEQAELAAEANAAVDKVLALTPDSWWGLDLQAIRFARQREWGKAVAAVEAADRSEPSNASNVERESTYGSVMRSVGRYTDALQRQRVMQSSPALDAISTAVARSIQETLGVLGRVDDAEAEYQRWLAEGHPADEDMESLRFFRLLAQPGTASAALQAQLQRLNLEEVPADVVPLLKELATDRAAALARIRTLIEQLNPQTDGNLPGMVMVANALGDKDLTLNFLEGVAAGQGTYTTNIWRMPYSGVRADPRFKQILRDLKIVDYYRESGNWGDFCQPVGDDDFECR